RPPTSSPFPSTTLFRSGRPSNSPTAIGLAASDRVARISQAGSDAGLARIRPVKAGSAPRAVAVGEGSVWVTNEGDGTVSRIDPRSEEHTSELQSRSELV